MVTRRADVPSVCLLRRVPTLAFLVVLLSPLTSLRAHDAGPPTPPFPLEVRVGKVEELPWTWEHWWEANRDLFLVPLGQTADEQQEITPEELAKLRDEAATALEGVCKDADETVRLKAVVSLGEVGPERSISTVKALVNDSSADVRRGAVLALGMMGTGEAVTALKQILESKDASGELKGSALVALGLCGGRGQAEVPLLRRYAGGSGLGRRLAIAAWGLSASQADARELSELLVAETDPVAAAYYLLALGRTGETKAAASLGETLADSGQVRLASLNQLKREAERKEAELARAERQRQQARRAVEDYTTQHPEYSPRSRTRVIPDLGLERLFIARIRGSAAIALGELGERAADEDLLTALLPDESVEYDASYRSFAAIALGQIGSERTVGHVLNFIYDSNIDADDPVRGFAVLALGLYARPRLTPQGMHAPAGAKKALAGVEALLRNAKEPPEVQAAAAMAAAISTDAYFIPILRKGLPQTEDARLVGYRLLALGMLGDQQSLNAVKQFLSEMQGRVDAEAVCAQRAAVLGMGSLRTQAAVPDLRKAFHYSYYVNREVVHALALLRAYSMVGDFKQCLDHEKPLARAFGAEALGLMLRRDELPPLSRLIIGHNFMVRDDTYRLFQVLANEYLYEEMLHRDMNRWR